MFSCLTNSGLVDSDKLRAFAHTFAQDRQSLARELALNIRRSLGLARYRALLLSGL